MFSVDHQGKECILISNRASSHTRFSKDTPNKLRRQLLRHLIVMALDNMY